VQRPRAYAGARTAANDIRIIFQLENHEAHTEAGTVNAQRAADTSTSGYNTRAHVSPTVLACVCENRDAKTGIKVPRTARECKFIEPRWSWKVRAVDAAKMLIPRLTHTHLNIFSRHPRRSEPRKVRGILLVTLVGIIWFVGIYWYRYVARISLLQAARCIVSSKCDIMRTI